MNRVIAYIDGYNLYHGLCDAGWQRYLWLNLPKLTESLLKPGQELMLTKYFTSRTIVEDQAKRQRQTTYIEALQTLNNLQIIEGKQHAEPYTCFNCHQTRIIPREKMTDINIAVEMLSDMFKNKLDTALLISADSDLVPVIKRIRSDSDFRTKRVIIAIPPHRFSKDLANEAHGLLHIGRSRFAQSLLPKAVTRNDGFKLECPETWS
ncbi:MAG TPA: NYN domain-containing protein [Dehalococcoidia bacterium]|nr:NYN domain-containing protein [Dehalococcoidia bacterium]